MSTFTIPKEKDAIIAFGEPSTESLDPSHIRILVWNMFKGRNRDWKDDFLYLQESIP